MKKGDTIIYPFGFGLQEAIITKVIGDYFKVKHKDFWFFGYHGYHDLVHKDRVLSSNNK